MTNRQSSCVLLKICLSPPLGHRSLTAVVYCHILRSSLKLLAIQVTSPVLYCCRSGSYSDLFTRVLVKYCNPFINTDIAVIQKLNVAVYLQRTVKHKYF
jgi:hypothetical protein